MTDYDLPTRQRRYFALSSQIAYLDSAHLRALFDTTAATRGWGRNHVIDGQHAYLTDFGLVLDERFELTPGEASFLKQGAEYDYAEILGSLGFLLAGAYESLPDTEKQKLMGTYGFTSEMHPAARVSVLLDNIEQIAAEGALTLDKDLLAAVVKYRSIIKLFSDFFASMRRNKRKDTPFPYSELTQQLQETGFLSGSI